MQNIGADNAGDAFYRYKMPKLVSKVRHDAVKHFHLHEASLQGCVPPFIGCAVATNCYVL